MYVSLYGMEDGMGRAKSIYVVIWNGKVVRAEIKVCMSLYGMKYGTGRYKIYVSLY